MGNDLSPMTGALRRPLMARTSLSPPTGCGADHTRSLYVPEITLRLRMGVDRETSPVAAAGGVPRER